MNETDLEQTITNRLRARLGAEQLVETAAPVAAARTDESADVEASYQPEPPVDHAPESLSMAAPMPADEAPTEVPAKSAESIMSEFIEKEFHPGEVSEPELSDLAPDEARTIETDSTPSPVQDNVVDLPEPTPEPIVAGPVNGELAHEPSGPLEQAAAELPESPVAIEEAVSSESAPVEKSESDILGADLSARFAAIKADYTAMADQLRIALNLLVTQGIPPDFSLQNALASAHRDFIKFRHDFVAQLDAGGLSPVDACSLSGLSDFDALLARVAGIAKSEPEPIVAPLTEDHQDAAPAEMSEQAAPAEIPVANDSQADANVSQTAPTQEVEEAPPSLEDVSEPLVVDQPADVEPFGEVETPEAVDEVPSDQFPLTEVGPNSTIYEVDPVEVDSEVSGSLSEPEPFVEPSPAADSISLNPSQSNPETILDRVLNITVKPGRPIPEFEGVLNSAQELKQRLGDNSDPATAQDVEDLNSGVHPLAAFLKLIEQNGRLGDIEWAELHGRVAEGLGRPIASAVARNRFALGS